MSKKLEGERSYLWQGELWRNRSTLPEALSFRQPSDSASHKKNISLNIFTAIESTHIILLVLLLPSFSYFAYNGMAFLP